MREILGLEYEIENYDDKTESKTKNNIIEDYKISNCKFRKI